MRLGEKGELVVRTDEPGGEILDKLVLPMGNPALQGLRRVVRSAFLESIGVSIEEDEALRAEIEAKRATTSDMDDDMSEILKSKYFMSGLDAVVKAHDNPVDVHIPPEEVVTLLAWADMVAAESTEHLERICKILTGEISSVDEGFLPDIEDGEEDSNFIKDALAFNPEYEIDILEENLRESLAAKRLANTIRLVFWKSGKLPGGPV